MDGILSVYKPRGITSFDVIRCFKKNIHPSYKVGHGGTLDPFAEGLLLLLLGKATKQMDALMTLSKTYEATAILGSSSSTLDITGTIVKDKDYLIPSQEATIQAMEKLIGSYEQEVPEYSAAKVDGKPRYLLARRGVALPKKTKTISVYNLKLDDFTGDRVSFTTEVSSGTYVRQLSYDIFRSLNTESYLAELKRTEIGDFSIEKSIKLSDFETGDWIDMVARL